MANLQNITKMKRSYRFFFRILLPSVAGILLFLAATFLVVIPNYRHNLMERKRETIRELTNSVHSLIHKLDLMINNSFSLHDAKGEAKMIVRDMRYGPENKDYFWITDTTPVMVMHPYRPDLEGIDLTEFRDDQGKNFFVEIVEVTKDNGSGFIDYKWQWKDDSLTVLPKLSFVKAYPKWGWIVGTGIYIDDVNLEISRLTRQVLWLSIGAAFVLAILISYLARRNWLAEKQRQAALDKLHETMERYKKVVETSTDGVLMVFDEKITYVNPCLLRILEFSQENLDERDEKLIELLESIIQLHQNEQLPNSPKTTEQVVVSKSGTSINILVNQSVFEIGQLKGKIYTVKDISGGQERIKNLEQKLEKFRSLDNLQFSTNILLQPLANYLEAAPCCEPTLPVSTAARIMVRSGIDMLAIVDSNNEVLGVVTAGDFSRRLVALEKGYDTPISSIMSSPAVIIDYDEMVIDAFSLMLQHSTTYVISKTPELQISYISLEKMSELRSETPEFLINSIENTESVHELYRYHQQLPSLIKGLKGSGAGVVSSKRFISNISDSITRKIIQDSIKKLDEPPADFVFLALGSEGRREQTLATDQDNAIIFDDSDQDSYTQNREFFLQLGRMVCTGLNSVGFPFCQGGAMAMNKNYCMGLSHWKTVISSWAAKPEPELLLKSSIFFDFRPVFGNYELSNKLQHFILDELKGKHTFFSNLLKGLIYLKPPEMDSSFFKKDSFDIKVPILALTAIVRFWALKTGVGLKNTLERLFALESAGVFTEASREEFEEAFLFLTRLRIMNQLRQLDQKQPLSNVIKTINLSEMDMAMLNRISKTLLNHLNRLTLEFKVH